MSSRLLLAFMATLVLVATVLVSGPAFSGEHPWDSDRTEGGRGTTTGLIKDTIHTELDSTSVVTKTSLSSPTPIWSSVVRVTWSVVMAM